jgi:hypothetical protein
VNAVRVVRDPRLLDPLSDIVLDAVRNKNATLIAAERTGRRRYGGDRLRYVVTTPNHQQVHEPEALIS